MRSVTMSKYLRGIFWLGRSFGKISPYYKNQMNRWFNLNASMAPDRRHFNISPSPKWLFVCFLWCTPEVKSSSFVVVKNSNFVPSEVLSIKILQSILLSSNWSMTSKNVISAPVIQIPPLSREEIHNLLEQTEYTERQIKEWQRYLNFRITGLWAENVSILNVRGFYEECPNGELSKQKLQDFYCLLLPSGIARVFVDQLFGLFDEDKSGSIDFNV